MAIDLTKNSPKPHAGGLKQLGIAVVGVVALMVALAMFASGGMDVPNAPCMAIAGAFGVLSLVLLRMAATKARDAPSTEQS